jgi:hypothetical protein
MSRYFQGLAQRSGLLAPLVSRSSVAGDLVEQDVVTTIEAPSLSNVPAPSATGVAQSAVAPTSAAVSSPTATTHTASRGTPTAAAVPASAVTHIVTTEHFSETSSAPPATPVGQSVDAAGPASMSMTSPVQRSHALAVDAASTTKRTEASNTNTINIGSSIEESADAVAPPVRAGNTTRARVLPEVETFERPRSSSVPGTAPVTRSTSRAAPLSIDVRIGAIKLDIHQAAPLQRPAAASVARSESHRDVPRFAPRRYYLSGW